MTNATHTDPQIVQLVSELRAQLVEAMTRPELLTGEMICQFYIPIGLRTLRRWIASGDFPRHEIGMGGKVRLWRRSTVEDWIASHVDAANRGRLVAAG